MAMRDMMGSERGDGYSRSGSRSSHGGEYGGGRYEARRLPPRNRYGEFRRRRSRREYNDGMGRYEFGDDYENRHYREDDWDRYGYDERREPYFEDEERERRRERHRRMMDEYGDDGDGYD